MSFGLDPDAAEQAYWSQNEFLVAEHFLDAETLAPLIAEANALRSSVHRSYVVGKKKGGSVSAFHIADHAPAISALYHSPELIALFSRLTREPLLVCPPQDPHGCALYFYSEPGDHIGYHYDTSFYKGKRYTVLLALIDETSSRLVCQLYKDDPSRETEELRVATTPGTMVLFDGDKLWHAVSPIAAGEDRVVLTLQYVTDQRMAILPRIVSDVKDAVAYFGIKSLFSSRRRG
jgi:hypothetical protein